MNPDRFVTIRCHVGFGHCCLRSSQVADQRFNRNNGLLRVLILVGSEKQVLPIVV